MKYDYTVTQDGYIIVKSGDARLLLDTGNPVSFGDKFEGIHGVTLKPAKSVAGLTPHWLAEKIGQHIDGVIGAEVLLKKTLHIDPINQIVSFSESQIDSNEGVPITHHMNVPIVNVLFNGQLISTLFDTGAPLGYVPKAMTNELRSNGKMHDFYPIYGGFNTEIFHIPVKIGDHQDKLAFGVFPTGIESLHRQSGFPTIIGLGLLKKFKISIGLRESRYKMEPLH